MHCSPNENVVHTNWHIFTVRFHVLVVASKKITAFWDVGQCSVVDVYWRFRDAYCLRRHRPDDGDNTHIWNMGLLLHDAIPEGSLILIGLHIHICWFENYSENFGFIKTELAMTALLLVLPVQLVHKIIRRLARRTQDTVTWILFSWFLCSGKMKYW
jgi:hypothetical protein